MSRRPPRNETPRALVYLAVSVSLMLIGPGRYALDAMLFKKRDWVAEEKRDWLKVDAAKARADERA